METAKRFLTKEKIDRQMMGQNSTPFMRMTEKRRKSVSFDANDILEKTNENMEKMTALMDKMYIRVEQKDVPYKPQIYQRGRGQNRRRFDDRNSWRVYRPYSRNRNDGNRGYGSSTGNFRRGNFKGIHNNRGRYNSNRKVDRTWENRRMWRQSRPRERSRGSQSQSPSSSRSRSRTNTNRDRIRCFRCREYDHFANDCPNQATDDSDKESDSAGSVSLHLADSDTGSDVEQCLNT